MFFDDVVVGSAVDPVLREPTSRDLVLFAAGSGDFNEIHYDDAAARAAGLPGVIVHGRLKAMYMLELVCGWMGPAGRLESFQVRFGGTDEVSRALTVAAEVASTDVGPQGSGIVSLDVWIADSEGQKSTSGSAVVVLPTRQEVR